MFEELYNVMFPNIHITTEKCFLKILDVLNVHRSFSNTSFRTYFCYLGLCWNLNDQIITFSNPMPISISDWLMWKVHRDKRKESSGVNAIKGSSKLFTWKHNRDASYTYRNTVEMEERTSVWCCFSRILLHILHFPLYLWNWMRTRHW